jgi:hypothetical protein
VTKGVPTGPLCGAAKRSGGTCGKPAGWGTGHPGVGRCKLHGGTSPSHNRSAAKSMAVVMGAPHDVSPQEALLWCVRIAAGEVRYCSMQVALLDDDDTVGQPETTLHGADDKLLERRTLAPALNIWIAARRDAVDRLARYSKMALDAGVAERQVAIAERYGQQLATMLSGVLGDLELTDSQLKRAPAIVQRHLAQLESGQQAA